MNCAIIILIALQLGVFVAFTTRHGAGPLESYSEELTSKVVDPNNKTQSVARRFSGGLF